MTAPAEEPSSALQARLEAVGVSARGWRRAARRHMRSLSGDLPLFDTTWVDACVCDRLITPWQAEALTGPQPDDVQRGGFVIESVVGTVAEGTLYSGYHAESRAPTELLELGSAGSDTDSVLRRLKQIERAAKDRPDTGIQWPRELLVEDGHRPPSLVMRRTSITTLRDWVTRYGRVPTTAVEAIANQLLELTARLQRFESIHGDIRLETIGIRQDGSIQLLRPGVWTAMHPVVRYREGLPVETCRGVAPERIGTNRPATAESDRYAIGCVLWELLAGRPLTPHGSALGCLRAHATRAFDELADFAPETSQGLQDCVQSLLATEPSERPHAFHTASPIEIRSLRRGQHGHQSRSRRRAADAGRSAVIKATAATVVAGLIWMVGPALKPKIADLAAHVRDDHAAASIDMESSLGDSQSLIPNADGVVQLNPGVNRPQRLVWPGQLTLRGAADGSSVVVVDQPWEVFASGVRFDRVQLTGSPDSATMVDIHAQSVSFSDCRIEGNGVGSGMLWTALKSADVVGGRLSFERCRIQNVEHLVVARSDIRELSFRDVLTTSTSHLVRCARWPRDRCRWGVENSTFRDLRSILDCDRITEAAGQPIELNLTRSILDLAGGALVNAAPELAADIESRVVFDGRGSVATWPCPLVAVGEPVNLLNGNLVFRGGTDGPDNASLLQSADVPLPVDAWPGVKSFPELRRTASAEIMPTQQRANTP